jgi:hypothetical protein
MLIGLVSVLFAAGCSTGGPGDSGTSGALPVASGTQDPNPPTQEPFGYPGQDGKTALELLLVADPTAEVQGTGANAFVVAIQGVRVDEAKNEFWQLSVNGVPATVGAGSLVTKTGDSIEWALSTF